eukprot:sb/3463908/
MIHNFGPRITPLPAPTTSDEPTDQQTPTSPEQPPEPIVTSEEEIILEKLDKQLRISIVCPDMENEEEDNDTTTPAPPASTPPAAPASKAESSSPCGTEDQGTTSSAALKDISEHVNELESVLESLSKGCPSPAAGTADVDRSQVVRTTRAYLDALPAQQVEMAALLKSHETALANYVKHSENVYLKQFENYTKQLKPTPPKRGPVANVARNSGVRSSPNVTISAESQLNLAVKENKNPTIIKPIPMMAKSPEKAIPTSTAPPSAEYPESDSQIDVVSPQPTSPESHGVKRKAECMDQEPIGPHGSPNRQMMISPTGTKREEMDAEEHQALSQLPLPPPPKQEQLPPAPIILPPPPIPIPSEAELTKQLMSVIQNTLSQTYTCQECGLIFPNELMLHGHMLAHLEQEEKAEQQYNCPTCAFKTPRRATLTKHINTVHARDRTSGILYCDQCEYKTPTKSHLRNHMLAHSGNRQYQCPHCTYSSNFSNALTRHMTMHSRELFESKAAETGTGTSQG